MLVTTSKGKSCQSPFQTDGEAAKALNEAVQAGLIKKSSLGFADSLLRSFRRGRLSHDQAAWIHILATEVTSPSIAKIDASKINLLFAAARTNLRFPRIRTETFFIKVKDGSVQVFRQADKTCIAKVVNHEMHVNHQGTPEDIVNLTNLCDDPVKFASAYGVRTGYCMFCGLTLTTAESVGSGYGPICAEKWSLPWQDSFGAKRERGLRQMLHLREQLQKLGALAPDGTVKTT